MSRKPPIQLRFWLHICDPGCTAVARYHTGPAVPPRAGTCVPISGVVWANFHHLSIFFHPSIPRLWFMAFSVGMGFFHLQSTPGDEGAIMAWVGASKPEGERQWGGAPSETYITTSYSISDDVTPCLVVRSFEICFSPFPFLRDNKHWPKKFKTTSKSQTSLRFTGRLAVIVSHVVRDNRELMFWRHDVTEQRSWLI